MVEERKVKKILHSKIMGQGNPLLILHGYFGMGDNWKSLANKFAKNFEVHLIDQRNHGRSFHTDDFNIKLMREDLYNYIQHHQLEKVNLIGHSMGGKTVMFFAVKYPKKVHKLIVVDISPRMYPPHHHEILEALNSINFLIQNTRKLVDKKLSEKIVEYGVRQFLLKNVYWKKKEQLAYRFNLESLTENSNKVGVALPLFTNFDGDTLFLKGGNSKYISKDDEQLIKTHFFNSKMITIPKTGHWLHAEKPMEFYNIALIFFRG